MIRSISDTILRLTAFGSAQERTATRRGDRLTGLTDFGSNPGALEARIYLPPGLKNAAPLIVVLHGCTQTAAEYDHGAGWSDMADRHGFALLFAQQQRYNNAHLCFNWFEPDDIRRDGGEALSIRQMIDATVAGHGLDRARVFVTGLSAGGAMASVMLATYPEIFAGGAIIAGMPYGCAKSPREAFDRMRGHGVPSRPELSALVRQASAHAGSWPRLSVWHGSADRTVSSSNGEAIVGQWRDLHGVGERPARTQKIDRHTRQVWCDDAGRERIEMFTIQGMGHGTPLDTGPGGCGATGDYMLDVNLSSTQHIVSFWDLAAPGRRLVEATKPSRLAPPSPAPDLDAGEMMPAPS